MKAVSKAAFQKATLRTRKLRQAGHAAAARYDRKAAQLVITLNTGIQIGIPLRLVEGLADASPSALSRIEITPGGLGLYWPSLDVVLYVPALLAGALGTSRWMARQLGVARGRTRIPAKALVPRENGRRGGRRTKRASKPRLKATRSTTA